jgi:hypothetical protein
MLKKADDLSCGIASVGKPEVMAPAMKKSRRVMSQKK